MLSCFAAKNAKFAKAGRRGGVVSHRATEAQSFLRVILRWGAAPYPECQSIICDLLALGVWGNAPKKLCFGGKMRKHPRAPASNLLRALCFSAPLREITPPHQFFVFFASFAAKNRIAITPLREIRFLGTSYQPTTNQPTTTFRVATCTPNSSPKPLLV